MTKSYTHKKSSLVFYVGMVNTPDFCDHLGVTLYVGAAFKKMSGVIQAMRCVGVDAHLLSLPVLDAPCAPKKAKKYISLGDGFPAIILPTYKNRYLRKIFGALSFARYSLFHLSSNDVVIIYNHAPEYLLLLVVLRFRGVKCIQDIEDLPIVSDKSIAVLFNHVFFRLTHCLTSKRKIVVSSQVAQSLKLADYLIVNGAYSLPTGIHHDSKEKWTNLVQGGSLCIHYGGTLRSETGLDLFLETLKLLDSQYNEKRLIAIYVTGIGDIARVMELEPGIRNPKIDIRLLPKVEISKYEQVLAHCHLSLSLKSPLSPLSVTTFPSKVIEAASRGLALITSNVSDISQIFDDTSVFYLPEYEANALFNLIIDISKNPQIAYERSRSSLAMVRSKFSRKALGDALKKFIFD